MVRRHTQYNHRRGSILLFIIMFGAIATTVIISGVSSYAIFENRASIRKEQHDLALHIAEAGINYYRWHLSHAPDDYKDGTNQVGPYIHEFKDKNDIVIGYFSLDIIPPASGTTQVTLKSTGWTVKEPGSTRTLQVRLAFDSFTDYALLSNASVNVGFTTVIHGPMHSNGGIRFDGTSDSWVDSAKETYQYQNQTHNGVWGGGGPKEFWRYPVPAFDFAGITADLAKLKDAASEDGIHLTSSGTQGWHLTFKTDGTVDISKVTSVNCYNGEGKYKHGIWYGTVYCYDIKTETFIENRQPPENGQIFVEDHVWVEGTVNTHVTVAAGRLPEQPSNYRNIYIQNNILYTQHATSVSLGLLTQGDIIVPRNVPENMTIEAAMLSQYGKVQRPYYNNDERDSLTVYGSQIAYNGVAWKYVNGYGNVISGFVNTNHNYDPNLQYYPPPGFPVGNTYDVVSWEELN